MRMEDETITYSFIRTKELFFMLLYHNVTLNYTVFVFVYDVNLLYIIIIIGVCRVSFYMI